MRASAVGRAPAAHETMLLPQAAAEHAARLHRMGRAMCGSSELAEDLVQETYVRVLARPRVVRGGDDFAYMARALRNTFLDHLRTLRTRPDDQTPARDLDVPDPCHRADPHAALLAAELYRTIAAMPEEHREVIALVDVAGLTYKETARVLRVPVGTVMSRLHRARARVVDAAGDGC